MAVHLGGVPDEASPSPNHMVVRRRFLVYKCHDLKKKENFKIMLLKKTFKGQRKQLFAACDLLNTKLITRIANSLAISKDY